EGAEGERRRLPGVHRVALIAIDRRHVVGQRLFVPPRRVLGIQADAGGNLPDRVDVVRVVLRGKRIRVEAVGAAVPLVVTYHKIDAEILVALPAGARREGAEFEAVGLSRVDEGRKAVRVEVRRGRRVVGVAERAARIRGNIAGAVSPAHAGNSAGVWPFSF